MIKRDRRGGVPENENPERRMNPEPSYPPVFFFPPRHPVLSDAATSGPRAATAPPPRDLRGVGNGRRRARRRKRGRRAAGGWRVDVTVRASSAAWANRCAHTRAGSIDPPAAAVCASRVVTSAVTSPLPRRSPRRRARTVLRSAPPRAVLRHHRRYTRYGFNIAAERARSRLSYAAAGHPCECTALCLCLSPSLSLGVAEGPASLRISLTCRLPFSLSPRSQARRQAPCFPAELAAFADLVPGVLLPPRGWPVITACRPVAFGAPE